MTIDSLSAVLTAIGFLVPGFVMSWVLALRFPRRARTASEMSLQYLTLSCLNHGLWSWLIVLMLQGHWAAEAPANAAAVVFVILFVSPVCLGWVTGVSFRSEIGQRLIAASGFNVARFIPTGWDFRFEQNAPAWVIVRLKDGNTVYGFWGPQSFAGDDPRERDLYLEAVFHPSDSGGWIPERDTGGILIRASEIATIEFRRIDEVQNDA